MNKKALFNDVPCRYFPKPGPANTKAVLDAVNRRAKELGITRVVVATGSGQTAFEARNRLDPALKIYAISRVMGHREPNVQQLSEEDRRKLLAVGVEVHTSTHVFGGVGRGVRNKLGTYQIDEVMAYTLRVFGHGTKVAVEIALMAADAGFVRTDEDVISIGGTSRGADTALVLQPANSSRLFDLKVKEVICKPTNL